ncbi:hypothetical protein ABZ352_35420 [Streptomyces griseofuscus]|uniref:hypothetical protein n=1 Tax=Streptomyces griseofuscus TaxID=146922 RepID=UPI0033CC4F3F
MPKNDTYQQGIQYPVLSDAPDIEVAMQTLVGGIVPKLVMTFFSANARAAALSGANAPIAGMITYLQAEQRWEGYQSNGTWLLLSDGSWSSITYSSGYSAFGGAPGYRKKAGGGVELRGRIQKSNGSNLDNSGDPVQFGSIPASLAPAAIRMFVVPAKLITTSGVTRHTARLEVHPDGSLKYLLEAGGGISSSGYPAWIGMDGVMFSPDGD